MAEIADGLEGGIQFIYLGSLLGILGFAGFIIVRQVLIRRELDASAKAMGERIRAGDATAEEYFEMGSIMLRKKVYTQAVRNLKLAAEMWEGDQEDLAQIHNALGFGYLETEKLNASVAEFKKAVELQPGYVTAWNNLGDALERLSDRPSAGHVSRPAELAPFRRHTGRWSCRGRRLRPSVPVHPSRRPPAGSAAVAPAGAWVL